MFKKSLFIIISIFSFSLAANQIMATDFTVREFIPGAPASVGYLKLDNKSTKNQVLTAVNIENIGRVEIHNHIHQNGMMRMVKLDELAIANGERVNFEAGGLHLMLFEPKQKLTQGETLAVTLHFQSGLTISSNATVVSLANKDSHKHHHHHH